MRRAAEAVLVVVALAAALVVASPAAAAGETLLSDGFDQPDGLITNAYAFWHPTAPAIAVSPVWAVHSGSLFAKGGMGWSGVPDDATPDACSCNGTGSAVLRAATTRTDFGDVDVTFDLVNQGLSSTASTPPVAWDGLHVWLRYQSEYSLYYVTVNRRDNSVIVKKKVPGGPASSNYGTYYDLSPAVPYTVPYGRRQHVRATVRTNGDGSVTIALFVDGVKLVEGTDRGAGGMPPLTNPGAVGLRGDNADLLVDDFRVTDEAAPPLGQPVASPPPAGAQRPAPPPLAIVAPPRPVRPPTVRIGAARRQRDGRISLRLACRGEGGRRCEGTLALVAPGGRRLGRTRFSLGAGERRAVTVRLGRAARRRLPRRVRAIATTAGGERTARQLSLSARRASARP